MAQLPDEYRVTADNPDPPLVHFAIPLDVVVLYEYADKHNLSRYLPYVPNVISPESAFMATELLSQEVQCELDLCWPFAATADCGIILGLYTNYTMEEKRLIDEDQEDVIQMVQEELGLDKSIRPKWYFDALDPWEPDDSDDETD